MLREESAIIPFSGSSLPKGEWIVFAPHPDDETFGMGGSIYKARNSGIDVFVVFITSGDRQGNPTEREKEALSALKMLGVPNENVFFWRMKDRELRLSISVIKSKMHAFIRRFKTPVIYAPSPMEYHPDHRVVSRIAYLLSKEMGFRMIFYEVLRESEVNVLLPLSDEEMNVKKKAMLNYRSQKDYGYVDIVESLNRLRSLTLHGVNYAEGFYDCSGGIHPSFVEYWRDVPCGFSYPPLSVIIRTCNRPSELSEALSSVCLQDIPQLEVVVVNDGGIDVSNILDEFKDRFSSIEYVNLDRNVGRGGAANEGLKVASGEVLSFLDDDDLYEANSVTALLESMGGSSSLVYGKAKAVDVATGAVIREYGEPFCKEKLLFENYIPTGSYVVYADVAKSTGFDASLEALEDWDFLIRLAFISGVEFVFSPTHVLIHRVFPSSFIKVSKNKRYLWNRIYEKHFKLFTPELLTALFDIKMSEKLSMENAINDLKNRMDKEINDLKSESNKLKDMLDKYKAINEHYVKQISDLSADNEKLKREIDNLKEQLARAECELSSIKDSFAWMLITSYRRIVHGVFFPDGTRRRHLYDLVIRGAKNIFTYGFSDTIIKTRNYVSRCIGSKKKITIPPDMCGEDFEPLTFKICDNPEASVIIPFHNKVDITYRCLKSIRDVNGRRSYEIILIDDASTEDVSKLKDYVSGIRYIRNDENLGFIKSCNYGAELARGKYLIFLNNDTYVTNEWMDSLISIFEKDTAVGLVGAKLLYPDGKLQEAGSIIWRDGTGWNYGKYDDPNLPQYSYLREVDYCSGACICVSKELFDKVGGFDEVYSPAYYEDTDLAFKIREAGYKVVFNPFSVVFHIEGATSGRDTSSGVKRYQEINKNKFLAKWEPVLKKKHFPYNRDLLFLARERRKEGVVIVADHYVPMWDKDSGSFRMYNLLCMMVELGYKVVFWPDNLADLQPYTQQLQEMGVEVIYGPQFSFSKYLNEFGKFVSLVWACRANFAPKYLKEAKLRGIKTVFDTIDLHFLREMRRAEIEGNNKLWSRVEELKRTELSWARNSDLVLVVSDVEKDILISEGISNVRVVPNVHHVYDDTPGFDGREGLMFIGSFEHPPNEDAVVWFVEEILPKIVNKMGKVKVYIVGNAPTKRVRSLASDIVEVTGYVPDVSPYFNGSRVFVSPLRYGAGLKGKVGQAMSYGLPVVTTSIGAEGFVYEDEPPFIIADDPDAFADAVVRLYTDRNLWMKYADRGKRYIKSKLSYDVIKSELASMLSDLVERSPWDVWMSIK